jgi:error-prone DNA polymerase
MTPDHALECRWEPDPVHPFIRRRRGEEAVTYDHPDLEPILRDTYGVILFQEQILEISHRFAGMSLQDADDFRARMSKNRESGALDVLRERFLAGALGRGVSPQVAAAVLKKVANSVGYGFCRSHAAAFAKTVYHRPGSNITTPGPSWPR